jgi:hypothetical protein
MENAVIHSGRLEYFTTMGYILREIGYFVVIWYIYISPLGILNQEKSGNLERWLWPG